MPYGWQEVIPKGILLLSLTVVITDTWMAFLYRPAKWSATTSPVPTSMTTELEFPPSVELSWVTADTGCLKLGIVERFDLDEQMRDVEILDRRHSIRSVEQ